ncbi:MAG: TetR/AcrR family transcriptional regulator [Actinomycetota bacterium]|nr:TetR/AcrR family transcriptional regulator [Actinomycetota bacterium]
MTRAAVLDRRGPYRGDQRRAALLRALDELLRDGTLDTINIADISRRAGVTRSAFYFYFENKAAAVAAVMTDMYDEVFVAAGSLLGAQGTPRERIEATIRGVFAAWAGHRHLYSAMLEARQSNSAVRELWDSDRTSFVEPIAAMIDAERAAGRAPDGPSGSALATVLLELNDLAMQRLALGDPLDESARAEVLVTIWLRCIWGTTTAERIAP